MRALDAFRLLFLRPGIALPVDGVLGRIFIQPFPPHGIVFEVVHDVGEDRALFGGFQSVGIGLRVGAGRHAEETVFGVHRPQSAVRAHADPRDIVAHAPDLIAFLAITFGGNEHGEVGLAAGGRERRRDVFHFAVGFFEP